MDITQPRIDEEIWNYIYKFPRIVSIIALAFLLTSSNIEDLVYKSGIEADIPPYNPISKSLLSSQAFGNFFYSGIYELSLKRNLSCIHIGYGDTRKVSYFPFNQRTIFIGDKYPTKDELKATSTFKIIDGKDNELLSIKYDKKLGDFKFTGSSDIHKYSMKVKQHKDFILVHVLYQGIVAGSIMYDKNLREQACIEPFFDYLLIPRNIDRGKMLLPVEPPKQ